MGPPAHLAVPALAGRWDLDAGKGWPADGVRVLDQDRAGIEQIESLTLRVLLL
ncbi:MAG: hypothetical protein ABSB01_22495 [Streptosporangiaceae bacterium]|jgi:hypothetical protein